MLTGTEEVGGTRRAAGDRADGDWGCGVLLPGREIRSFLCFVIV